jgi:hypothetical protein
MLTPQEVAYYAKRPLRKKSHVRHTSELTTQTSYSKRINENQRPEHCYSIVNISFAVPTTDSFVVLSLHTVLPTYRLDDRALRRHIYPIPPQ